MREALQAVLNRPRECSVYCRNDNERGKEKAADDIVRIFGDSFAEITALKEAMARIYRRNRALMEENRKRAEYTNQLLRQTQWLVGELREAREEARTKQKFNQIYLKASGKHQEQIRLVQEERDEAFRVRDAALLLLAKAISSSSNTEKE